MGERTHSDEFDKVEVSKAHEVWAIDYTCFDLLGIRFAICVVYELYSQAYLAITPGVSADISLAKKAVAEACTFSGTTPEQYLLSDNGSQFCSDDFEEALRLAQIDERKTPPGQPWYNGALESGNRDLKRALYSICMYTTCKMKHLAEKGTLESNVFGLLTSRCAKTMDLINNKIPRVKFGVTPSDVLNSQINAVVAKQQEYKNEKIVERQEVRKAQKLNPAVVVKCLGQRVKSAWNSIAKSFDDDTVFAIRELLHGRYSAIKN